MSGAAPGRFVVELPDEDVARMLQLIDQERRRAPASEAAWASAADCQGFDRLCDYWLNGFDWSAQQARLNEQPQFTLEVDGVLVHFVHQRAADGPGTPLLLAHSWPSTFLEYLPLVPVLTNPSAYGIPGPGFDVVIPSLPGFGFSERPRGKAWSYAATAGLWHRLMQQLGYSEFAVSGTGFGAGVASMMAWQHPERMSALQLNSVDVPPPPSPEQALSTAELLALAQSDCWDAAAPAQPCGLVPKSNMLSFALADSPYSVAAWIVQRWRLWAGPAADLSEASDHDSLLTMLSLYWLTGTTGASILDFYDNRAEPPRLEPGQKITVPTAIGVFPDSAGNRGPDGAEFEWQKRLYRLERITEFPRIGSFGVIHDPQLLARELFQFVQDCAR